MAVNGAAAPRRRAREQLRHRRQAGLDRVGAAFGQPPPAARPCSRSACSKPMRRASPVEKPARAGQVRDAPVAQADQVLHRQAHAEHVVAGHRRQQAAAVGAVDEHDARRACAGPRARRRRAPRWRSGNPRRAAPACARPRPARAPPRGATCWPAARSSRSASSASSMPRRIGGNTGFVMSGSSTPIVFGAPVDNAAAARFGRQPSSRAATSTRCSSSAPIRWRRAGSIARDTVLLCTPRCWARSLIVGRSAAARPSARCWCKRVAIGP